ncbi:MAG TPA: cytochrome P450 [Anaerovoracaceae bacterium]|nr:cytochrome P450 [Anaerovoracaceae bacterium]
MKTKDWIAEDKGLDKTLSLMREGYLFIKNRTDKFQCNMVATHLMGEKVICMSGEEAAKLFYEPERFQRKSAAPKRVQKTLLGENAIQSMDGDAHIHRKHLFLSLLTPPDRKRLTEFVIKEMEAAIRRWEVRKSIVLFDEGNEILCKAVCLWAGIPLRKSEIRKRAEDFSLMVDAFGAVGLRYWKGKMARSRAEEWIKKIIEDVRSGKLKAEKDTALYNIAFFKEPDGCRLNTQMAAIELINVLRPVVAISTYITFAALALHDHPEYKEKLLSGGTENLEMFAQEVRRFYPFGPFLGARVKKEFQLNDYTFEKGMLVLLDMYGTNHDPMIWDNPNGFCPERFRDWKGSLFDFIPQGGGDPTVTHRCPGEGITVDILIAVINFLVSKIEYNVPKQDLSFSLSKMPTLPESGFIMSNIKRKGYLN